MRRSKRGHSLLAVEVLESRFSPTVDLSTNFIGMGFPESGGSTPPDTDAAAGPNHIVEVVNTAISIYDKTTGSLLLQQDLGVFFASVSPGSFLFDPVVSYDELMGRFLVVALDEDDVSQTSFLEVAVSNSSDPTAGFTEMHKITIKESPGGVGLWGDYPKIGWNADAVVLSVNMFTFTGGGVFDHVQLITLDASTLTDANNATFTKFQVDRNSTDFTMAAASMHGSVTGDPMWFVEESTAVNKITVVKMTNILSATPTFTDTDIAVASYGSPPAAEQSGTGQIESNDTRILNAALRGNRLVACQTVANDSAAQARWYEFDVSGAPTLTQSGTIDPGSGVDTFFPSIEIASNGDLGMTYIQSSPSTFMSMYVTGRKNTDTLGTMQPPTLMKAGAKTYKDFSGSPYRAGDYSGISVDPSTGTSFWAANEYATSAASNNWGTWLGSFSVTVAAPPLPTISINNVSLTEGNSGTKSFTFTVTLSAVSGSTVTVDYATANGTASSASDYTSTSNTLSFTAGQVSKTITVLVNGDGTVEFDETFFVNLTNPTHATILDNQGLGTIVNDDAAPLPTLSIDDVSLTEGNIGTTNFTFTVTLSAASASSVTVKYATANGTASSASDYAATNSTLTFTAGQTSKTVTVAVNGDVTVEANETFFINLTSATNATILDNQGMGTILNDDVPPVPSLTINNVSATEGNSGTKSFTFTVLLSAASGLTVTVDFATADGSANAGSDYQANSGTVTFTAGQTSQSVTVLVNGDTTIEGNDTFLVNLSNPTNATIADNQGVGTITNDDFPLPMVSINDVSHNEGNSGMTTYNFTVSLSSSSLQTVTVDFTTTDNTALAGSDYTATSGTLTFNPGVVSQTITVLGTGDTVFEPTETFFVDLSNLVNALFTDSRGQGTLTNDDSLPALSITDVTQVEGNSGTSNFVFTINLAGLTSQTVTVNYATANGTATAGSDYATNSGTLTFASGTTSQTVSVSVTGDNVFEANETFFVNLSAATNATIADPQGLGTVTNDDPTPALTITDVTQAEGNSESSNFVFTLNLSNPSSQTVMVNYATADGSATAGSDYTANSGTVTFGSGVTSQTISVAVQGDTIFELNESFALNLSSPTNATIADAQGVGLITNDDPLPTLSITDAQVSEGDAGTVNAVFTVTLSSATSQTVTVNFATVNGSATAGSDYAANSGTLTFAAGQTTQTVTVTVNGDQIAEANETFLVNLTTPANAGLTDGSGAGTILDNDIAGITVTAAANLVTTEWGGVATFDLVLTSQPTADVVIGFSSSNTTEGTLSVGLVTFTPQNWKVTQTVTVTGVNDYLDDGDVAYTVVLTPVVSADASYSGMDMADLAATNLDNDTAVSIVHTELDGDLVTVKLSGGGVISALTVEDPNPLILGPAVHEPLQIILSNTTLTSKLTLATKKAAAGDGFADVGVIISNGSFKTINAKKTNLTGEGVNLAGWMGSLSLHDILSGAEVKAGGLATQFTKIKAHDIGDGSAFVFSDAIKSFTAARMGDGQIVASSLGSLSIKGDSHLGISGDFAADITLSGAGVLAGKNALNKMTVKGLFQEAWISVQGEVGTIQLGSVATNHGGVNFGVMAQGVKSLLDKATGFSVKNPLLPFDQSEGDFHVQSV